MIFSDQRVNSASKIGQRGVRRVEIRYLLAIFGLVFTLDTAPFFRSFGDLTFIRRDTGLQKVNGKEKGKFVFKTSLKGLLQRASGLFIPGLHGKNPAQLINAVTFLKGEEYLSLWLAHWQSYTLILYLLFPVTVANDCGPGFSLILPSFYLNHKLSRTFKDSKRQLGDALVIMANALRAGFGFQQSMDTVRRELPPPIASEFGWTLREMNLGVSQEEALLNLSRRVGNEDLDMIVTGIIIQRQIGGNLAEILDNIANTIRDKTRIKREIRILTAQGRLSGLIIGILPLILILILLIINPGYFQVMIKDIRGVVALASAAFLEMLRHHRS